LTEKIPAQKRIVRGEERVRIKLPRKEEERNPVVSILTKAGVI